MIGPINVCLTCGALVAPSAAHRRNHERWHAQLEPAESARIVPLARPDEWEAEPDEDPIERQCWSADIAKRTRSRLRL